MMSQGAPTTWGRDKHVPPQSYPGERSSSGKEEERLGDKSPNGHAYLQRLHFLPHHRFIYFINFGSHVLEVFMSGAVPMRIGM